MSDYNEHLISMAGGDGDVLAEIEARAEYFPPLLTAHSNGESSASVYEEADGLETICYIPSYYSAAAQDRIADAIVEMEADRRALLALVREQAAKLEALESLAAGWKPPSENADLNDTQVWYSFAKHHSAQAIRNIVRGL